MSMIEATATEIADAVRQRTCDFDTAVDLITKYGELKALMAAKQATTAAFDSFQEVLMKGASHDL